MELQQPCPLVDARAPVVVKLGKIAPQLRLVLQPDWLSLRAEVCLRVRRVWLCLFQMVKRLSVVPAA